MPRSTNQGLEVGTGSGTVCRHGLDKGGTGWCGCGSNIDAMMRWKKQKLADRSVIDFE